MATTSDFRNGLCLHHQQDIYTIVSFQHVKPGKGGAFVRTKLKSLTSGKIIDHTFNAGMRIEEVRVERRSHQFLYADELGYHFMNSQTYEQITLSPHQLEDADLLKEGQEEIELLFHAEKETVLSCSLPNTLILKVKHAEPGLRGDTATNALKPVTLETGATLHVPLFIEEGTQIKIDVKNRKYAGKVK